MHWGTAFADAVRGQAEDTIDASPKTVVAALNGPALGGGCEAGGARGLISEPFDSAPPQGYGGSQKQPSSRSKFLCQPVMVCMIGVQVSLACHYRVASPKASVGFPEAGKWQPTVCSEWQ